MTRDCSSFGSSTAGPVQTGPFGSAPLQTNLFGCAPNRFAIPWFHFEPTYANGKRDPWHANSDMAIGHPHCGSVFHRQDSSKISGIKIYNEYSRVAQNARGVVEGVVKGVTRASFGRRAPLTPQLKRASTRRREEESFRGVHMIQQVAAVHLG